MSNEANLLSALSERLLVPGEGSNVSTRGQGTPQPYASSSGTDTSLLSSPTSGPPQKFSEVVSGVYRSSYPKASNFDHLSQLGLKTILTLVPEEYPIEYDNFTTKHGIKHLRVHIPPHKHEDDMIPPDAMAMALGTLLDPSNHPILVHCNKGKHRTGCVVGCYRKMNGWKVDSILKEYVSFAGPKAREMDKAYIQAFDTNAMSMRLDDNDYHLLIEQQHDPLTPPLSEKDVKV